MARSNTFFSLALVCLATAGHGCGDDTKDGAEGSVMTADASAGTDAGAAPGTGAGADASEIDPTVDVPCPNDFPQYHDGMTQKAGDLTVKLLSVSPAPPRQQTPNNWALSVLNADGSPATGFTVTSPDSYMPVHRHHGRQPPKVVLGADPGAFKLDTIDFFMRGPWQVIFSIVPATGGDGVRTTFQVCVN